MNETLDCLSRSEAEKAIAEWQTRQEYGPERSLTVTFPDGTGQTQTYIANAKPGQPNGSFEKIPTYGEIKREPVPAGFLNGTGIDFIGPRIPVDIRIQRYLYWRLQGLDNLITNNPETRS